MACLHPGNTGREACIFMEDITPTTGIRELREVLREIDMAINERDNLLFVLGGNMAMKVIRDKIRRMEEGLK